MTFDDTVPTNLEEAVGLILESLTEADKEQIIATKPELAHFSLGMFLRNGWSLWEEDTPIKRWFADNFGLSHADDISGIILHCVWSKVHGKEDEADKLAERFKRHWIKSGIDPLTQKLLKNE